MIHIALHFIVPCLLALIVYRTRWKLATFVLIATMIVDVDHLLAVPIYDPNRCSIGFHPLHKPPAIVVYFILFFGALGLWRYLATKQIHERAQQTAWIGHLIGLGLLIHMALDWGDCYL